MTNVRIRLRRPDGLSAAGALVKSGSLYAAPTRRYDTPDGEMLPLPVQIVLKGAVRIVTLAPTGTNWCWAIREVIPDIPTVTRYVTVPDTLSVLDYENLVEVDPNTLDPSVEVVSGWAAAAATAAAAAATATAAADAAVAAAATVPSMDVINAAIDAALANFTGALDTTGVNALIATGLATTPFFIYYNGSAWPNRPANPRAAIWRGGPAAPATGGSTSGGVGMADIDLWWG